MLQRTPISRLSLFLILGATTLFFAGCELDEGDGANADMTADGASDGLGAGGADAEPESFRFVRIDDMSDRKMTIDGGADIDAVLLEKSNGTRYPAIDVEGYRHGGGTGDDIDPTAALGLPDAFYAYPDTDVCDVDDNEFVSIGGMGGYLIVEMEAAIDPGDRLTVLEVGGCDYGDGTAFRERVNVSISVAEDYDGQWTHLGTGEGPEISLRVPQLQ